MSEPGTSSRSLQIAAGGIVVALILAGLLTQFLTISSFQASMSNLMASHRADQLAEQINRGQQGLKDKLNLLALNSETAEILLKNDPEILQAYEEELQQQDPALLHLRLIAKGKAILNPAARYPFSYAAIDMVNRSEAGEDMFAEAANLEGEWILTLAQPVRKGQSIIGTLYGYFSLGSITYNLTLDDEEGYLTLFQQFANAKPRKFYGAGSRPVGTEVLVRSLQIPHWKLEFQPTAVSAASSAAWSIWLPLGVFFIVSIAAAIAAVMLLEARIGKEAQFLKGQLKQAARGAHKLHPGIITAALRDLDEALGALQLQAPQPDATTTSREPGSSPEESSAQIVLDDVIDIEMMDGEPEEMELDDPVPIDNVEELPEIADSFRAYDIRGIVNETLTPDSIFAIGQALGTQALSVGEEILLVGMDGRISSPAVAEALIDGLLETGIDVTNLGMVPTPVVYFATHHLDIPSAIMITASHNPAEYNGFKIVLQGHALQEEEIQALYKVYQAQNFATGKGQLREANILEDYANAIYDDIVVAQPLNVVIDCGNGVTGELAPDLFANLGCEITPLYCDIDGDFPNHPPDPSVPKNLEDLILAVTSSGADLGIAFDGDGDRMVAVSNAGNIIWPDRLLMLFAKDIVSRNPGSDVIYDIKSTRHLNSVISSFGGRPILCRSGHSYLKAKMAETGALLGGELSGHFCINERWYGFDDGLYSAARLLEIIGAQTRSLEELIGDFPHGSSTAEIKVDMADDAKFNFMTQLTKVANFDDGTLSELDGLRVDYPNGWGLVRASNTMPCLTLRFEGDDDKEMQRIKSLFKEQMLAVDPSLQLDF